MMRRSFLFPFLFQARPGMISWRQVGEQGADGGKLGFKQIAPPADNVVNQVACDVVMYVDAADQKLKIRKSNGTVVVLG